MLGRVSVVRCWKTGFSGVEWLLLGCCVKFALGANFTHWIHDAANPS
jgi:hypothetical protein